MASPMVFLSPAGNLHENFSGTWRTWRATAFKTPKNAREFFRTKQGPVRAIFDIARRNCFLVFHRTGPALRLWIFVFSRHSAHYSGVAAMRHGKYFQQKPPAGADDTFYFVLCRFNRKAIASLAGVSRTNTAAMGNGRRNQNQCLCGRCSVLEFNPAMLSHSEAGPEGKTREKRAAGSFFLLIILP